jgi:hypothetical protein
MSFLSGWWILADLMGMPPTQRKSPPPPLSVDTADFTVPDHAPPATATPAENAKVRERELGGTGGPEPTRFGDWEKNGRCIDF